MVANRLDVAHELADTPIVVIDMSIVRDNITRLQKRLDSLRIANRPHIKTHKIARLAQMQIEAGAIGIACQKIGEAEIMADAGIDDILIPYNIVGEAKVARLVRLADRCRISVSTDNTVVVAGLSAGFRNASRPLQVLVECDTGAARCGVQSPQEGLELAAAISTSPGLAFAGLMTYPPMEDLASVNGWLVAARDIIKATGIECPNISTGGTPNLDSIVQLSSATEHRAGTYIYNDRSLVEAGRCTIGDCALRVFATVVSRPTATRAIIDAGSKILTSDLLGLSDFGHLVEAPTARIFSLSEEHGSVDLSKSDWQPNIGDVVSIIPNHACVVSNMVDRVYFVDGEKIESVSVDARGCSR